MEPERIEVDSPNNCPFRDKEIFWEEFEGYVCWLADTYLMCGSEKPPDDCPLKKTQEVHIVFIQK